MLDICYHRLEEVEGEDGLEEVEADEDEDELGKVEEDEDEDELETVEGDEALEGGHGHPCLIDLWQVLRQFGCL